MKNHPEKFVYWLQGYVELHGEVPSKRQWDIIKEHLQLVFEKETELTVGDDFKSVLKLNVKDVPSEVEFFTDENLDSFPKSVSQKYC
jgi:hypothetical protein